MTKEFDFKLENGETETMKFRASGLTPILYKHLTGEDLISDLAPAFTSGNGADAYAVAPDLAFVMYAQANPERYDPKKLTEEDLEDWLDSLESFEIENHADEILTMYMASAATKSISKNTRRPSTGR